MNGPNFIFRVHYMTASGAPHVYCRIFVATAENETGAAIGNLTMRKDEFKAFREAFKAAVFFPESP